MGYEDFVWFILSEEDKGHDLSLEYWFRCCDLDCDGALRSHEMLVRGLLLDKPASTAPNLRVCCCGLGCRGALRNYEMLVGGPPIYQAGKYSP